MTKPKSKGASPPGKTRESSHKSESTPRLVGKVKPDAASKRATVMAASRLIDERILSLGGWRAGTLAEVRRLIHEADPEIVEECKWVKPTNPLGVPVWSHAGIVCTGETYNQAVKLTFARGASLKDPRGLFNSSLEGNARRAIDIREGESIDAEAFKALIRAAVAENLRLSPAGSKSSPKSADKATRGVTETKLGPKAKPGAKAASIANESKPVRLLSGGNPQIAKGYGDAPVQAYIAAIPGWKRELGKRLDALIVRAVPNVYKAVKWNTPFYGIEGDGWFLGFHCFTRYIKVSFFRGTSLRPVPPGKSKLKEVRYLDIHEDDELDEAQFTAWVKQASQLPGERM